MIERLQKTADRLADFSRRYFLVGLLLCYVAAAVAPGYGRWITDWSFSSSPWVGSLQTVLLAVALFVSALSLGRLSPTRSKARRSDQSAQPSRTTLREFAGVAAGFTLFRAVAMALAVAVFVSMRENDIALGLLIVLAMPAALSSVPWSAKSSANVRLTLALIVVSLLLSPLLLWIGASFVDTRFGAEGSSIVAAPLIQFLWFLPPVALGLLVGSIPSIQRLLVRMTWLRLINPAIILLLNYANASRVVPKLGDSHSMEVLVASIGAVGLAVAALFWLGARLSNRLTDRPADRSSITYASGMLNTGMAMVLVSTWLPHHPDVLIPVMLFTLLQHIFAAVHDRGEHTQAATVGRPVKASARAR